MTLLTALSIAGLVAVAAAAAWVWWAMAGAVNVTLVSPADHRIDLDAGADPFALLRLRIGWRLRRSIALEIADVGEPRLIDWLASVTFPPWEQATGTVIRAGTPLRFGHVIPHSLVGPQDRCEVRIRFQATREPAASAESRVVCRILFDRETRTEVHLRLSCAASVISPADADASVLTAAVAEAGRWEPQVRGMRAGGLPERPDVQDRDLAERIRDIEDRLGLLEHAWRRSEPRGPEWTAYGEASESSVIEAVRNYWASGRMTELKESFSRQRVTPRFARSDRLEDIVGSYSGTDFWFVEDEDASQWLLVPADDPSESWVAPLGAGAFGFGHMPDILRFMFDGFEYVPERPRFEQLESLARVRSVPGETGRYTLVSKGRLALAGVPRTASPVGGLAARELSRHGTKAAEASPVPALPWQTALRDAQGRLEELANGQSTLKTEITRLQVSVGGLGQHIAALESQIKARDVRDDSAHPARDERMDGGPPPRAKTETEAFRPSPRAAVPGVPAQRPAAQLESPEAGRSAVRASGAESAPLAESAPNLLRVELHEIVARLSAGASGPRAAAVSGGELGNYAERLLATYSVIASRFLRHGTRAEVGFIHLEAEGQAFSLHRVSLPLDVNRPRASCECGSLDGRLVSQVFVGVTTNRNEWYVYVPPGRLASSWYARGFKSLIDGLPDGVLAISAIGHPAVLTPDGQTKGQFRVHIKMRVDFETPAHTAA